jgi:hypothetical protein
MSTFRPFIQLSLIGALVAWYQLPVMAERSHALTLPGHEALTDALDTATATVGQPVVALRAWSEQSKLELQAGLLEAATPAPVVLAAAPVSAPVAASAPPAAAVKATEDLSAPVLASVPAPGSGSAAATKPAGTEAPPSNTAPPGATGATKTDGAVQGPSEKGVVAVLAGDSVMGEIAFGMQRWAAKAHSWTIVDAHKVSSGLSNTGYYNWPVTFHNLLEAHHPKVVLMMVGANDAQDIFDGKHRQPFGTPGWQTTYADRVHAVLKDATAHCTTVYWTLMPVVRDPGFEKKQALVRQVIREAAKEHGDTVRIIDPNERFLDSTGRYAESARINGKSKALRADDGIHLSWAGAQVFVDAVLDDAARRPVSAASCRTDAPAAHE